MRIVVMTFKGAPLAEPIHAEFGAGGGTIGREAGNRLMLPDPERHISRVQARVIFEGGNFLLEDLGGNPSLINARPVGRGTRVQLADGDRICVGQYEMQVDQCKAELAGEGPRSVGSDPLGLFGDVSPGGADPFRSQARSPLLTTPAEDPFGVFFHAAAAPVAPPESAASLPDPFAPAPRPAVAPPSVVGGMPALDASVDALFGIRAGEGSKDPFAGTSLSGNVTPSLGQAPVVDDPLALFGGAVRGAVPDPMRDDAPLLAENIGLPRVSAAQASPLGIAREGGSPLAPIPTPVPLTVASEPAVPAPVGATPPGGRSETGAGIVLSWSASEGPNAAPPPVRDVAALPQTEIYERRKDVQSSNARPPRGSGSQAFDVVLTPPPSLSPAAPPPSPAPEPIAPAPAPSASPDVSAVLLAAFQRGLGMPIYAHGGLTPERMEQLGVVVREAVSGTMGLLKARATTKREFRADMTMIVSRENNPLKFAPDIEFALFQLLEPKGGGFLAAEPAMRDAYLDLRSHQFGFLAGMRAAIGGLIQRFKPEVLEQRISRGGFLASVLPGARKARLWDLYEQHYAAISREAEDDFDALFGREFLKAYEEQIERLRDEAEDQ
ncbi:type VI secretion system-associated FHA domain protein TagH [Zoogloea sp.]|jgi:FHA domain-containing protein|uniref:type VI secretion system-associated FHA domain protein TagH n=1 Tax=Zoogloea sp. TaxID=49181 RepID=UPI0037D9F242